MFHITPAENRVREALSLHSQKIAQSAIYLLNVMREQTQFDAPGWKQASERLRHSYRFHPEIHFIHNHLIRTMRANDVVQSDQVARHLIATVNASTDRGDLCVDSIGADHWEATAIGEAVRAAKVDTNGAASAEALKGDVLAVQRDFIRNSSDLLQRCHPEMYDEIRALVWTVKLFVGRVTQGLTDTRVFGEIYIRVPRSHVDPVFYYAEHMVHEASHLYLNCLMAQDPIVLNQGSEMFPSPLRKDPRPMYAVFHATFVAARMALTFRKIFQNIGGNDCLKILAEVLDEAIRGVSTVKKLGQLTVMGWKLLVSIEKSIDDALSMPAWAEFDFDRAMEHRCGAGVAKFDALARRLRLV